MLDESIRQQRFKHVVRIKKIVFRKRPKIVAIAVEQSQSIRALRVLGATTAEFLNPRS